MSNSKQQTDFLLAFAAEVKKMVDDGFYDVDYDAKHKPISMSKVLQKSRTIPIITEVKFSSPSKGTIRKLQSVKSVVSAMERGGARAISVLTQPKHFNGSLENLKEARRATGLPIVMKDFIFDTRQILAAKKLGADAILLIERLFTNDRFGNLSKLIDEVHSNKLEVLLEVNTAEEYERAIKSDADMIGINNRNLGTLEMDMETTAKVLKNGSETKKLVISESGVFSPKEMSVLAKLGAGAFLVGTSIMLSADIEAKVRELASVQK
ncbi:MAG: indole-3-glycerol-phosphate synthase [Thaumarchaeota archaeon]|nr:indole-3-glycerol-phosphate synthase [Nitrososphaerota archaeon]